MANDAVGSIPSAVADSSPVAGLGSALYTGLLESDIGSCIAVLCVLIVLFTAYMLGRRRQAAKAFRTLTAKLQQLATTKGDAPPSTEMLNELAEHLSNARRATYEGFYDRWLEFREGFVATSDGAGFRNTVAADQFFHVDELLDSIPTWRRLRVPTAAWTLALTNVLDPSSHRP